MISFQKEGNITITCHNRLMPWLTKDLAEIGFTPVQSFPTGIKLRGNLNDCIRLNLSLRCASQVLYSLRSFTAFNADDIYAEAYQLPWEEILPDTSLLTITSNVNNPTIRNSMFANVRVKDAIVDRLRKTTGNRPDTGPDPDGAVIHLFWKDNKAELFLDTSGHSIGRHGYRKIPGQAPMLEALAAATVLATNWDRKSPFLNPMCGSGTIAIEAALIATNRRPGLFRDNYAFMHLLGYEENVFQSEKQRLKDQIQDVPGLKIYASDHSRLAIRNTKLNADAAEVLSLIEPELCDFGKSPVPANEPGVIFFNPEYGLRLGELKQLEITYARIGDFLKQHCKGYTGYIFTGNLELAKKIGLKPKRRIEFYSSKIDCRLLEYELYAGSKKEKG